MALRVVTVLVAVISTAALSLSSPPPIFSSISASPASLPAFPPAISPAPELPPPSLSPDITPEFPTPGAGSGVTGSPSSNEMPTIPSTLSPPNPDDVASPELNLASSPASSPAKMSSSAVRLVGRTSLPLLVFCFVALLLHVKLV
ncbi:classical arabinogalactan protein 26-like [Nymphaea colorata]|uniref:Uncharacterized protein n=1 Tax=Nymphaea colorata TaxID=210225 RepID=A0A5K0X8A7_9MAGN|nr:classical arabinogalactan protein 26-like [Nymphaea colorata]